VVGKPKDRDLHYDPKATWVEERIVLLRARSDREAAKVGRAEAQRYLRGVRWVNPYGQRLEVRLIGVAIWQVVERLEPGQEVFSYGGLVDSQISDGELRVQRFGCETTRRTGRARKVFAPGGVWREFSTGAWWDGPAMIPRQSARDQTGRR
jgi:hypothetical protein